MGCLVIDLNVGLTLAILGDTGAISADIVLLVSTMAQVLKMLHNRSADLCVCTVQLFMRKCVYGDMVIM